MLNPDYTCEKPGFFKKPGFFGFTEAEVIFYISLKRHTEKIYHITMETLRKQHHKTPDHLKNVFIDLLQSYELGSMIRWNGFEFEGKTKGTRIRGKIFENEIHVEISGWFEKIVARKLQDGWNELVMKGVV